MKRPASLTILLLLAATLADPAYAAPKPKKPRGQPAGNYTLTITGYCTGTGTAAVSDKVSLSATVKVGSSTGNLTATDLPVVKGYFKGAGTILGVACTLEGRVDLPDAQDDEENNKQAITARITGTFKTATGKVGRFVAIQQNPTPNNKGNGKGNGS
jgi:hypothetical protein